MANNHSNLTSLFTDIADAIRSKTGGSDPIIADQFPEAIEGISSGGGADNGFPIGDGNTHIWIEVTEGRNSPVVGVAVNGTVTVDWGDGTAPDTLTGTNLSTVIYTPLHKYASEGKYVITLAVASGEMRIYGASSYSKLVAFNSAASGMYKAPVLGYLNSIKKVECGNNVSLGDYAFASCGSLSELSVPDTVTSLGGYVATDCWSLNSFTTPNGVSILPTNFFRQCSGLRKIIFSDNVTHIQAEDFAFCYSLTTAVFSKKLVQISSAAFKNCFSVGLFDFSKCETVPKLTATDVFTGVPSDCVFRVPAALYDEWIAATNWSAVAGNYTFVGV